MILKSYQLDNIDFKNKIILFYGENEEFKKEEIEKIIKINKIENLIKYDENFVIENRENFFNEILTKSLFEIESKKLIIINNVSEKILKIIEQINTDLEIIIILNSKNLEKKSKLRAYFEKNLNLICAAFYPDTFETLNKITNNFIKKKKLSISQSNLNILINKCNGSREHLKNELEKIFLYFGHKIVDTESLLKLINLSDNHKISLLIDNCLAKNIKQTSNILNENNYGFEDSVIIIRSLLNKAKKLYLLTSKYEENKDIEKTITDSRPPIFWKDKEITKIQIKKWNSTKIKSLIFEINNIELQIKKNLNNAMNILNNFIIKVAI